MRNTKWTALSLLGLVLASVALGTWVGKSGLMQRLSLWPVPSPTASETSVAASEQAPATSIPDPAAAPTKDRSALVRDAIKRGDFAFAQKTSEEILANSHMQPWRFYPFGWFIGNLPTSNDPAFEAKLTAWIQQQPDSAIPRLIRARYHYITGLQKRGSKFASQTPATSMRAFVEHMKLALEDVDSSLERDAENPFGFLLKLNILRGVGASEEMVAAFYDGIGKHPRYYAMYEIMLGALAPKWGGSIQDMYAFVDHFAGKAPEHSPLKFLYVTLYRDLLSASSTRCVEHWRDKEKMASCVTAEMEQVVTPELKEQVSEALKLADHSERYYFATVVGGHVSGALNIAGGDRYAADLLQKAATSLRGETQLNPENPGNGHHTVDMLVAESWFLKGFYDNALSKVQQALVNVKQMSFPTTTERDTAIASMHRFSAKIYSRLSRFDDMMIAEQAAILLDGKPSGVPQVCFGQVRMRQYDEAIASCTETIDQDANSIAAHYWRGVALRETGRVNDAFTDLTLVAESGHSFRSSAAINLSMLLLNRNDIRGALNLLNKYTYLYDEKITGKSDIAASYNNRCYAHMQLGQLKTALDDCKASLKYGDLPDAHRKMQDLVKRLNVNEKSL